MRFLTSTDGTMDMPFDFKPILAIFDSNAKHPIAFEASPVIPKRIMTVLNGEITRTFHSGMWN